MSMLQSHRREAKSAAAFHFTMEAAIKKDQNKLDVFQVCISFWLIYKWSFINREVL